MKTTDAHVDGKPYGVDVAMPARQRMDELVEGYRAAAKQIASSP
jgi:hypothetical protein